MAVAGDHRTELVSAFFVGDHHALVVTPVVTLAVGVADTDCDIGYRAAVDARDPPANPHALAAVAGAPQFDHFRFAAVGFGGDLRRQRQAEEQPAQQNGGK